MFVSFSSFYDQQGVSPHHQEHKVCKGVDCGGQRGDNALFKETRFFIENINKDTTKIINVTIKPNHW